MGRGMATIRMIAMGPYRLMLPANCASNRALRHSKNLPAGLGKLSSHRPVRRRPKIRKGTGTKFPAMEIRSTSGHERSKVRIPKGMDALSSPMGVIAVRKVTSSSGTEISWESGRPV
jgi:hypothetical protein